MKEKLETSYPLSPMQQGMLVSSIHDRESGVYLQQLVCALPESIDLRLLVTSWRQVIKRHAVLRTGFRWDGLEDPLQEVHTQPEPGFVSDDWSDLTATEQEQRIGHFLDADRRQGFELTDAPLMRVALFKLGERDYRMIWTFHHALLDGRSHFLVIRELFDSYEALCTGRPLQLEQPRPYREYIDWLGKQDQATAEVFWRASLGGFTTPTSLRVEKSGSVDPLERLDHASSQLRVSEEITAQLRLCARQNEVTLNTLVQASWALLLSRYSGEGEVLFGATRACRHWAIDGDDQMVGLFINTLPFRVRVQREQPLRSWLKEIRAQHLALRDVEYTSLIKIKEWSDVPPGTPLFDSVLVFEDYQMDKRLRALGGEWEKRDFKLLEQTNYLLTVAAYAESDLQLKIEYDRRRFDQATIGRLLEHFRTVLEGLPKNLDCPVGVLPFLTSAERQRLIVDWNRTAPFQRDKTISELFEAQVEQTPDVVAVVLDDLQITYRELNERANQLARHLQKLGVGPEVMVAICVERSPAMIVGLLGILKAGGAYVPLDSDYPQERLLFMLEDTQARVLITREEVLSSLPTGQARVVCLDRDRGVISEQSRTNVNAGATADNLAYVMYTSGSTGQPKGVSVGHRSVVRLVKQTNYARFSAEEVFLQFAPISFDASTFEVWGALLNGARLAVMTAGIPSLEELGRAIREYGVTTLWLTAGLFQQMVESELDSLKGVRQLLAGGDVLSVSHVEKVLRELPECRLINGYGPTENTTFTCCYGMGAKTQIGVSVPIGRPIANTTVYILDHQLELVPVGVPGELYIGGDGLAHGYLNRPELTAAKFVCDLFSVTPGARLYRTGDRVRYLPDGNIEFLGRVDNQVKIRGFRIELGEIEAVLAQHEDVRECVVIAREKPEHGKELIAYLVVSKSNRSLRRLREFLREKLPEYMVPSEMVYLDQLPLNASGKIDRRALPSPSTTTHSRRRFAGPRTATEEFLARIWHGVLKRDQIGSDDNFFDLGGNSLLATQVISRVRDLFRLEIPVRSLFDYPRLTEFGALIDRTVPGKDQNQSLAMAPLARKAAGGFGAAGDSVASAKDATGSE